MYSGYTTTTLTLRAKGSFSYNHNDRVGSCRWDCIPSSDFSIHGFHINPRFLYGYCLRQSTLIQWSPSRSFLSGGAAAGARFYRLGLHDRHPSPSKDTGRCGRSWTYRRARDPDGSYREMIGLLADIKCCYQESIGIRSDSERSELGRSGRISEGEVRIKSVDGDRRRSSRGEDVRGMRKDGSNSSYYSSTSSSLSGDSEPKGGMCRRVAGECRNGYSKYGCGVNSVDTAEKEVKEVREYGGGARSERRHDSRQDVGWDSRDEIKLRENDGSTRGSSSKNVSRWEIRDKKEKDTFLMDHVHEARERYIREEQHNVGQRDSRGGSRNLICEDNTNRASNFQNVVDTRKRATEGSSATFVKRRSEIDQQAVGSTESRSSQKLNEITEIHGSNIRRDSDSKRRFEETRLKDRVDASSSVQNIVVARDKRFQMEVESNQQNKNIINVSKIHGSDTGKPSSSQIHVETRTDDREHDSILAVDLVRRARERHNQISEHANHQSSSRRATERNTKSSELSRSEIKGVSNFQEKLHEDNSTSVINRVHGSREEQNKANEYSSRRAYERDTKSSEFSSSKDERVSNSQGISITRIENQKQTSSTLLVQNKKDKQKSILTGENSQSDKAQREFSEMSDDSRDETYQSKDDKLESARRLDKSSALYVGEFVDRLNQEISASVELDTTSNRQTTTDVHLGVIDAAKSSINETHTQESARQSSSRSGVKGPSDEMWDVRGTYPQEPSRTEEHEEDSPAMVVEDSTTAPARTENSITAPARTENSITLRRHKSLWTYIADIVRMGWVLRAESSKHKSSSNESVSSEAWFSGHEHDENDDETDKGRSSAPKGPVDLTHQRTPSVPSQGSSEASRPVDMITLTEASSSTSTGSIKGNPSSKGASPVSEPVEFQWTKVDKARQGIPSSVVIVDQSSALTGGTVSQTTVDQSLTKASSSTSTGSIQRNPLSKGASPVSEPVEFQWTEGEKGRQGIPSSVVTVDQSSAFTGGTVSPTIEEEITEVGRTEGKDGELKRRKLQRNKQVLKEQFDEWEEAYKLESEQRKMDEFFMREALLEAKKAGDTWEVPVGAVLVQNGKIIARGYNLVEALRDSTAHAEMICIREASNLLHTWRLAETTLYVTLEPCAMCAGAILQARIETLVWGAPNKLLGADGSWVRLFPGEGGGSNSLDPSGQRVGPVHPFHPKMTIRRGILPTECSDVMQEFFQLRRRKKTEPPPPPPPSCLPISTHPAKLVTKMHDIFCMMFCL